MIEPNSTIGITGGIGAGKSVVSRILRCNGFDVYDCDYEAKCLMVTDKKVKEILIAKLGREIFTADGSLNRGRIAKEIFSNSEKRHFVNSVVHKVVREDIKKRRERIEGTFFIESAIISSGGIAPLCNQIWIVESPLEVRLNRIMKRDNADLESIQKRIATQEHEISLLPQKKLVYIENNNKSPLLPIILKLTNKLNNQQIYSISC